MRLTNRKRGCAVLVAGLCMLVLPHHPAKSSGWAAPKSLNQVGVPVEAIRAVVPADNSQTLEKIALGVRLFFDGRLSVDGTVACGTCHDPARAFTDGRPASVAVKGRIGQRNAPTILNAMYNVASRSSGTVARKPWRTRWVSRSSISVKWASPASTRPWLRSQPFRNTR